MMPPLKNGCAGKMGLSMQKGNKARRLFVYLMKRAGVLVILLPE